MKSYSLTHLKDHELVPELKARLAVERSATAETLAYLAEVDARRLYRPEGYPSMYEYCVRHLRLSEDAAFKRIQAARVALRFPAIFAALAEARLHLSAVVLLTPHLVPRNADELLAAATHKTKAEIEQLLAERYPKPDVPTRIVAIAAPLAAVQLAPGQVGMTMPEQAPSQVAVPPRTKLAPLSAESYALQVTLTRETHDLPRLVQAMLGHTVPSGDIEQVLNYALTEAAKKLEQRTFAPRVRNCPRRGTPEGRSVPVGVRREVWMRDGGQCTFTSDKGHRCEARTKLELDHIDPFARGGPSTTNNLRLRCHAHNQYTAKRTFGAGFMERKRHESRHAIAKKREVVRARARAAARPPIDAAAEARARAAAEAARDAALALTRAAATHMTNSSA